MSPTCCEASKLNGTVTFFVPATQTSPAHWVVPLRNEDGKICGAGCTAARFCPFCGVRLTLAHVPFDADARPYGATGPSGDAEERKR
jgi:hypothetical protein